jgi:hypothetical protein
MTGTRSLRRGGGFLLGVVLLLSLLELPAAAQDRASGRIPTVTRLVRIMTINEEALSSALEGSDQPAVERLLADDFEMRIGTAPATPVARDDWIRNALVHPGTAREREQMSAHEMGEFVVASFLERPAGGSPAIYVVDIWKKSGAEWKLSRRFSAPGTGAEFAPVGSRPRPMIPKKP